MGGVHCMYTSANKPFAIVFGKSHWDSPSFFVHFWSCCEHDHGSKTARESAENTAQWTDVPLQLQKKIEMTDPTVETRGRGQKHTQQQEINYYYQCWTPVQWCHQLHYFTPEQIYNTGGHEHFMKEALAIQQDSPGRKIKHLESQCPLSLYSMSWQKQQQPWPLHCQLGYTQSHIHAHNLSLCKNRLKTTSIEINLLVNVDVSNLHVSINIIR